MGLIKAAAGAFGGTMADQWKEFFYCEAIDNDVLVVKGEKRIGGRSSNKRGNDNIISNGSGIAVADGQCMIIVEQGKVVEVCAEPGEFTYDTSSEPSIFSGNLSEGILNTFDTMKKRFAYGGDTGKDQRVYYFNTKELIGNVEQQYDRDQIQDQLKTEFVSALQPAFAQISELGIRPSAIPGHVNELCDAMNKELTQKWKEIRGLAIVSIAMNPVTLPEEDAQLIKDAQKNAILRDPTMAAATLAGAQADAMKSAASNTAGAMTGFMGMGMAQQAGGANMQGLYQMGAQQAAQSAPQNQAAQQSTVAPAGAWKCECGAENTGKFCAQCGKPKPQAGVWTCSCGTQNTGKFCAECGKPRPQEEWTCECGTVNKGKFCAECGRPRP